LSKDRREQIVAAARALLADDPQSSLAVRTVATRAGIGASTLRYYFPTQQALREAVLVTALEPQLSDLRISDPGIPARDRLRECLEQLLPPVETEGVTADGWLDVLVATFGPNGSTQARQAWAAYILHSRARIARWLDILAEEGTPAREGAERGAVFLLTFVDGLAVGRILPAVRLDLDAERAALQDAIDSVLRPPDHISR
jgi:TetR/AcrR family transcriptional regulator, cholesterol catabolism regulator